jgi:hypothetical protein
MQRPAATLDHWVLNWDNTRTTFLGPVNIQESIKLDANGSSNSGSLAITPYSPNGNKIPGGAVRGFVSATRVRANWNRVIRHRSATSPAHRQQTFAP